MRGKRSRGTTAIELLVVLVVMSILTGAIYYFQYYGLRYWREADAEADRQRQVRKALFAMSREIRQAAAVVRAGRGEVVIRSLFPGREVRFYYSADEKAIRREAEGEPATTVARYIGEFVAEPAGSPRLVRLTVSGQPGEGQPARMRTVVYLRNYRP